PPPAARHPGGVEPTNLTCRHTRAEHQPAPITRFERHRTVAPRSPARPALVEARVGDAVRAAGLRIADAVEPEVARPGAEAFHVHAEADDGGRRAGRNASRQDVVGERTRAAERPWRRR